MYLGHIAAASFTEFRKDHMITLDTMIQELLQDSHSKRISVRLVNKLTKGSPRLRMVTYPEILSHFVIQRYVYSLLPSFI